MESFDSCCPNRLLKPIAWPAERLSLGVANHRATTISRPAKATRAHKAIELNRTDIPSVLAEHDEFIAAVRDAMRGVRDQMLGKIPAVAPVPPPPTPAK